MTIGAALAVITAGAILKWAVTAHLSWIDLQTTGTVLFVVGLVALPLSIVYTFYWAPRGPNDDRALRPPPRT
jgi:hypothetical protein